MSQPNLYGGETTCGYCGRTLEPVEGGCWECPSCAPDLRRIRTEEEWIEFLRRKARAR